MTSCDVVRWQKKVFKVACVLVVVLVLIATKSYADGQRSLPPRVLDVKGCEALRSESAQCIGVAYNDLFAPAPKIVVVGLDSGRTCYSPYSLPKDFLGSTSRSLGWIEGKAYFCAYEKYSSQNGKLVQLRLNDGRIEYGSDCLGVKSYGRTLYVVRRSVRGMEMDRRQSIFSPPGKFKSIEPIGESFAIDSRSLYSGGSGRMLTMFKDFHHPIDPEDFHLNGPSEQTEGLDVLPGKVFVSAFFTGEIHIFDLDGRSRILRTGAFGLRGIACRGKSSPITKLASEKGEPSLDMSDLLGTWSSPCREYNRSSYQVDLEFSPSALAMSEKIFTDNNCSEPVQTVRTEMNYTDQKLTGGSRLGFDFVVNIDLPLTVNEVYLTVHSERALKSGSLELIANRLKIGRRERVTGWATALGPDFAEGFPVKGETHETWSTIPSVLKVRMKAPHVPFEIYRAGAPADERAFERARTEGNTSIQKGTAAGK